MIFSGRGGCHTWFLKNLQNLSTKFLATSCVVASTGGRHDCRKVNLHSLCFVTFSLGGRDPSDQTGISKYNASLTSISDDELYLPGRRRRPMPILQTFFFPQAFFGIIAGAKVVGVACALRQQGPSDEQQMISCCGTGLPAAACAAKSQPALTRKSK